MITPPSGRARTFTRSPGRILAASRTAFGKVTCRDTGRQFSLRNTDVYKVIPRTLPVKESFLRGLPTKMVQAHRDEQTNGEMPPHCSFLSPRAKSHSCPLPSP